MNRFLCAEELKEGARVKLSDEESHHLVHVLRTENGARVCLIDGKGTTADGIVVKAAARASEIEVGRVTTEPARSRVAVVFALPKSAALDFLVRRCAELGVEALVPLESHHSSMRAKEFNRARWMKVLVEVGKQCEDPHFPRLDEATALVKWLGARDPSRALVVCDEADRAARPDLAVGTPCDLVVGAEGGWSDEERLAFKAAGAKGLGLGKNRLRAEMAAVVGATLLKQLVGEIG